MANVMDIKGTSQTSFLLGKGGATLSTITDAVAGRTLAVDSDLRVQGYVFSVDPLNIGSGASPSAIFVSNSNLSNNTINISEGRVGIGIGNFSNFTEKFYVNGDIKAFNTIIGSNLTGTNTGDQTLFKTITDGTNTATPASTTDPFRLRTADNKLSITVANTDPTFGKNALFTINEANLNHSNIGGVINDTIHGNRGGGTLHAIATTGVAGFMSNTDKSKLDGIAIGATANSTDAQLRDRTTHTGVQAISTITNLQTTLDTKVDLSSAQSITGVKTFTTLPVIAVATTTTNGFMSSTDKTKLDGVQSGATANSTDAQLRDRTTHTGVQPISTITNLQTTLDGKEPTIVTLPISKGGTGSSTQNFVDLSTDQTIAGIKTFTNDLKVSGIVSGSVPLNKTLNITMTGVLNDWKDIGNIQSPGGGSAFRITLLIVASGVNVVKTYEIISTFQGIDTGWKSALPTKSKFFDPGNDVSLDVRVNIDVTSLRLRKINTTSNSFVVSVRIEYLGATEGALAATFTQTSATGNDTTVSGFYNDYTFVTGWIPAPFNTNWRNFGAPYATGAYRKRNDGLVELKGLISKDLAVTNGEAIFNLPAGHRPAEYFLFSTLSSGGPGRIEVQTNGDVVIQAGDPGWITLHGISYIAEQ